MVFESKKVSVLVADPRHTKVNVKAEFNRSGNDPTGRVSESRPRFVDPPSGVSSSTIDQLQVTLLPQLSFDSNTGGSTAS